MSWVFTSIREAVAALSSSSFSAILTRVWRRRSPRSGALWAGAAVRIKRNTGWYFVSVISSVPFSALFCPFSAPGESASYYELEPEVGAISDRVLDGLCFVRRWGL